MLNTFFLILILHVLSNASRYTFSALECLARDELHILMTIQTFYLSLVSVSSLMIDQERPKHKRNCNSIYWQYSKTEYKYTLLDSLIYNHRPHLKFDTTRA